MTEQLVLGGGCFWCIEAAFRLIPGVISVTSGYMGGSTENPTYEQVCMGITGHAEVAQIEFDPSQVTCEALLEYFFVLHDPTTINAQGNDVGTQYRSCVFYANEVQQVAAVAAKEAATEIYEYPIVTKIEPLSTFWPAEDYHQHYFERNPLQPYCQVVVAPKVAKMRALLAHQLLPSE